MDLLVVGADGMVGRALLAAARRAGLHAEGTSRHPDAAGCLALDLAQPLPVLPEEVRTAVLCAGITSLAACAADPEGTATINIRATLALAERLRRQGSHVLYLSSNLVFDGRQPFLSETSPTCPRTVYGRQKVIVEEALLAAGSSAILRLTKVVTTNLPLIREWVSNLAQGHPIYPHCGRTLAPLPLDLVSAACLTLAAGQHTGPYHLSAEADTTYDAMAFQLAQRLRCPSDLVQAIDCPRDDPAIPAHTVLAMPRLEALGVRPSQVDDWLVAEGIG